LGNHAGHSDWRVRHDHYGIHLEGRDAGQPRSHQLAVQPRPLWLRLEGRGHHLQCSNWQSITTIWHILRGRTFGNRTWCSDWRSVRPLWRSHILRGGTLGSRTSAQTGSPHYDHYGIHLEGGEDVGQPHPQTGSSLRPLWRPHLEGRALGSRTSAQTAVHYDHYGIHHEGGTLGMHPQTKQSITTIWHLEGQGRWAAGCQTGSPLRPL
jgi:hypothetical protein